MRWVFVILLVLNIIYFGWELDLETRFEVQNSRSAVLIPPAVKQLQLISELKTPPETRELMDTESVTTVAAESAELELMVPAPDQLVAELPDILLAEVDNIVSTNSCYRYGPMLEEQLVIGLHDWFRSRNAQARIHFTEEQGANMFWIYLTPQQSRENALAVLEEMKNKGIGDYRLISRGELVNAISLGLFSSREAVDARLMELQEKGYVPVIVPYSDVKNIYWLDVQLAGTSAAMEEMFNGYPAKFASVPVACEGAVIGEYAP